MAIYFTKSKNILEQNNVRIYNDLKWWSKEHEYLDISGGTEYMLISYNNLWKTLIDKGIKKGKLSEQTGVKQYTC